MYIITEGSPLKVPVKLCKEAVKFYGRKLLSDSLYHKIDLEIIFKDFAPGNRDLAYCEWLDTNDRGRMFAITVKRDMTQKKMLLALAHEMVHLKQYAKGELKDYLKVSKSKWRGQIMDHNEVDYWEQPWEIEAYGREIGLYVKFREHLKKGK